MQRLQSDIEKYRQDIRLTLENYRKRCILKILAGSVSQAERLTPLLCPVASETAQPLTTLISCGQATDSEGRPHQSNQSCGCVVRQLVRHGVDQPIETTLPKMNTLIPCEEGEAEDEGRTENCGGLIGQEDCICCGWEQSAEPCKSCSGIMGSGEKSLSETSFVESNKSLKVPLKRFCDVTCFNPTFRFNYPEIYDFKDNQSESLELKQTIVEALDSDRDLFNKLQRKEYIKGFDQHTLDESLTKYCLKIFHIDPKNSQTLENESKSSTYQSKLNYNLDYYDPEDDALMDGMLKDSLDIMKQDPKFVLASLPEVHRLPLLREWIRLRYGKRYSRQRLTALCERDHSVMKALNNVSLAVPLPLSKDLGSNLVVDYSCRDYLLRKVRNIFRNSTV